MVAYAWARWSVTGTCICFDVVGIILIVRELSLGWTLLKVDGLQDNRPCRDGARSPVCRVLKCFSSIPVHLYVCASIKMCFLACACSLIGYGAAMLVQERLMLSSDVFSADVCKVRVRHNLWQMHVVS